MDEAKKMRINELAKKAKLAPLTEEEKHEQTLLREEYLSEYRKSLAAMLDNTYIQSPDGARTKLRRKNESAESAESKVGKENK